MGSAKIRGRKNEMQLNRFITETHRKVRALRVLDIMTLLIG